MMSNNANVIDMLNVNNNGMNMLNNEMSALNNGASDNGKDVVFNNYQRDEDNCCNNYQEFETDNDDVVFNNLLYAINKMSKEKRCMICGSEGEVLCMDCKPILKAGVMSRLSTTKGFTDKCAVNLNVSTGLQSISLRYGHPSESIEIIKRYLPGDKTVISLTDEEDFTSSPDDFVCKLINARYHVFEDEQFLYLVSKWETSIVLLVPKIRMTLLTRLIDFTLSPEEFEKAPVYDSNMTFREKYSRNLVLNMIFRDPDDNYWRDVYFNNFHEYPPMGFFSITLAEDDDSKLRKWAVALWEKVKGSPQKIKSTITEYFVDKLSSKVCSSFKECASKIIVVLAEVIFGFVDPFGILELLYAKMLSTCPENEEAPFYQQTWFLKLLVFITGVLGFILTCFGISSLESYISTTKVQNISSESANLDVVYNVATYLIPSYFPDLSAYDVLDTIKPYWNDFLSLFSWTPSRTAAGLMFIMSFMPKCISAIYYKFFGNTEEKGGLLYCQASEHYDKVVILAQQPGCSTNPDFAEHINKALALIRSIPPTLAQQRGYTWAHNMKKELNKYKGQICSTIIAEANRPVGAWFHFFGESGVGKSHILPLVKKFAFDRFYYRDRPLVGCYSRPNNTVFNNGYRGQEMEIWDEYINIDDAATRNAIMGETLPKLCPTSYMPQMASLEASNAAGSKGTPCATRMVLSANNLLDFPGCTFEMESALARRRNLVVEVTVDRDKFGPDNNLLPEWAPYANDPTKLGMKFIVYQVKIVDRTITYEPTEPINWEQLCDTMLAKWEYVQAHNKRMNYVSLAEQTERVIKTEAAPAEEEKEEGEDEEEDKDEEEIKLIEEDITTIPKGVDVYKPKSNLASVYPYFNLNDPYAVKRGFCFDPIYGFIYSRNAAFYDPHLGPVIIETTKPEGEDLIPLSLKDTKNKVFNTVYVNDRALKFYNFLSRCFANDSNPNKTANPSMIMTREERIFKFDMPTLYESNYRINYNPVYKNEAWFGNDKFSIKELCTRFMVDASSLFVAFCDVYATSYPSLHTLFQEKATEVFNLIALIHLNSEKKVKGMGYDDKLNVKEGFVSVANEDLRLIYAYIKHLKNPKTYIMNLHHPTWDPTVCHPKFNADKADPTKPGLSATNYTGTPAIKKNFFRVTPTLEGDPLKYEDEDIKLELEEPESEAPSIRRQKHGFVKDYRKVKNDKREEKPNHYYYAVVKRTDGWHLCQGTPEVLSNENGFSIVSSSKDLSIGNHLVMKKIEEYEKCMKDTEMVNEMLEVELEDDVKPQDIHEYNHHRKFLKVYRGIGSALRLGLTLYQLYKAINHTKVEEDVESLIYSESYSPKSVHNEANGDSGHSKKLFHYNEQVFEQILEDCTLSDSLTAHTESTDGWQCIFRLDHVPYRAIYIGDKTFITHKHQVSTALGVASTLSLEINGQTVSFMPSDLVAKQSTTEDLLFIKFTRLNLARPPVAARFMYINELLRVLEKGIPLAYLNSSNTKVLNNVHYVLQQSYNDEGTDKVLKHCLGYTGNSVPGDCGSGIYIERKGKMVIGIHTAGGKIAPTVKKGYATMLYKEKIAKYVSQFDELSKPQVESFTVGDLDPLPEDFVFHEKKTTKLIRTEFADLYNDQCKPAILSIDDENNENHINPYAYTIEKLVSYEEPPVVKGALERAVSDMRMWVSNEFSKIPQELVKVWDELTIDEIVAGHGRTELEPINHDVSGGYPDITMFASPYSRFIFEKNKPIKLTFEYKNYVLKLMDDLIKGKLDTCYFIASTKDEQQRLAKWLEGRTRLVYEMSQAMVIVLKFLFRKTMIFFNKHYGREFCHTLNVHGHDFHNKIYNYLTQLGATKFVAGDYKAFDMNVHPVFQREALSILLSVSGQPRHVINNTINYLMSPTILLPNGSLKLNHGQFSGNIFTSISNCMINCLYLRYCWYLTTDQPFDDCVRMVVCGDDNVVSIVDSHIDKFNGLIIAKRLASIGNVYTSDKKDEPLREYVPFTEITFGGAEPMRERVTSIGQGRFVGILTEERVKASLSWTFDPDNGNWLQTALRFAITGYRDHLVEDIKKSSYYSRPYFRQLIDEAIINAEEIRKNTYRSITGHVVKTESIAEVPEVDTVLEVEEMSDSSDNDVGEQPPEEVLKNFFYRDTISIATSASRGAVVYSADIYHLMFKVNNLQTQVAKGYQWFRPSPKVEFIYNGQPLTQGLFRAIWVPLVEDDYNFNADQLFAYDNYVDIKAHKGEHAVLKIDYLYNKAALPVVKGSGGTAEYFGKLFVVVASPLYYQTGTNMNITVQVSYDDTEFSIPKPPVQDLNVVAEGINFDQLNPQKTDNLAAQAAAMPTFSITANTSVTDKKKEEKKALVRRVNRGRGKKSRNIRNKQNKAVKAETKKAVEEQVKGVAPPPQEKVKQPKKRRRNNKKRIVKSKRPQLNVFEDPNIIAYIDQLNISLSKMTDLIVDIAIASVPVPQCMVGVLKKYVHGMLKKTGDPVEVLRYCIGKLGYYDQPEDYAFTNFNMRQPPMASTNYGFPCAPMEFKDPSGVDPMRVDIRAGDTQLSYLMGREELVADVAWSDNQVANTTLVRFWLDGLVEQNVPSKIGVARALLQAFKFARYDIVFKIRVIKNNFQNGALRFITAFGEFNLDNTGYYRDSSYNKLMTVQGENDEFEVTVPYTAIYQYLKSATNFTSSSRNETNCMGCCALEVANPLVLSSATVASTVRVLVTVHYSNVMVGVTRPILPYYSYDYRNEDAVIVAEALGPDSTTEEPDAPELAGEEDDYMVDLVPLSSIIEICRREILIRPESLKSMRAAIQAPNLSGSNTPQYLLRTYVSLDYKQFFFSSVFRAYRGGFHLRIKTSNPRHSLVSFYPGERVKQQYYSQVIPTTGCLSGPSSALPVETVWYGDMLTTYLPYRHQKTFMIRTADDSMGTVECCMYSTNAATIDGTFWLSFADDTEMGCFVPQTFNLQRVGSVADLTLPSE